MAFYYTDEVVNYMMGILTPQQATWGLNGIYEYDQNLTPQSPALLVVGMPRERNWVGTHLFQIRFHVTLFLVNGNMNISKSARQSAVEHSADQVVAFLDADMKLGDNIVQGWVERDVGGDLTIKPRSTIWAGHRIEWMGEQRQVVN